jgi:hypothetical protein
MFDGRRLLPDDHLCVLYRGPSQRHRLMLAFISGGLNHNEPSLCIGSGQDISEVTSVLAGRSFDGALLQVAESDRWLPATGRFDVRKVIDVLDRWFATTFETRGRDSARAITDMTWAASLARPPSLRELARFGRYVTKWVRTRRTIGVSMYDLDAFGGALVLEMVGTHSQLWIWGTEVDDPYAA